MAQLSLIAQSTAVPAFLLVKVLAPAFYSRQDTRTPVKAAVVSVLVNLIMTVALMSGCCGSPMPAHAARAQATGLLDALGHIPGAHALLALAIAMAGWINALQLWWYLRRAKVYQLQPGWGRFLRQIAVASVGDGRGAAGPALELARTGRYGRGGSGCGSWRCWSARGAVAYGAVLWLQGIRPRDLRGH